MQSTSGSSSRESVRSSIEPVGPLTLGRLGFLLALGALTVVLHRSFHYPLNLPGHHGLEAMALLVLGRLSCTNPFAASIVCLSALATQAGTGGEHDLSAGVLTLAPGLVLDALVFAWPRWRQHLWVLPVLVSIAFATKPVLRVVLSQLLNVEFGSLRSGVLYPLVTHLAYGFMGAAIAVALWRVTMKRWRQDA